MNISDGVSERIWKVRRNLKKFEQRPKNSKELIQKEFLPFFKGSSFRIPLDSFELFRMLLDVVRLFYILSNFFQFYSDRFRTLQILSDPCRLLSSSRFFWDSFKCFQVLSFSFWFSLSDFFDFFVFYPMLPDCFHFLSF